MQFKGSAGIEEFWSLLETESPRGLCIVVAAYFDERLGDLLNQENGGFSTRITLGLAAGLLTPNEHADLHVIRKLRNSFAHNLRANTFDVAKSQQIDNLKTWRIIQEAPLDFADLLPNAKDRLLYVASCFYVRLNRREGQMANSLPEPPIYDTNSWPPIMSS